MEVFNKKMDTLVLFIDFEKAYDSVWREQLLVELNRYRVKGKLWKWIDVFLNKCQAKITINKT